MRALVVINPKATTTSARTRDVLLSALEHDLSLEVAETTHRGHAIELAAGARAAGMDLVVSVGGDGTINEIVNGILRPPPGRATNRPDLAIIPGGSTNVLGRNLGIPQNPVEATGLLLEALRTGRRLPLSLGRLDDRYFTFAAGAGLDADVMHAVEQERARGRTATTSLYVRTSVRRFFQYPGRRAGSMVLEADGAEPVAGLGTVVISNCSPTTYLGSMPLRSAPRADFNAGLDVFALRQVGTVAAVRYLSQMATARGPRGRHVVSLHDQEWITLTAAEPVPVQIDGDYIGLRSRMELHSVPSAIRVAY